MVKPSISQLQAIWKILTTLTMKVCEQGEKLSVKVLQTIFDFISLKILVENAQGEENYQIEELKELVYSEKLDSISCFIDRDKII